MALVATVVMVFVKKSENQDRFLGVCGMLNKIDGMAAFTRLALLMFQDYKLLTFL